jgi:hypothetical protein
MRTDGERKAHCHQDEPEKRQTLSTRGRHAYATQCQCWKCIRQKAEEVVCHKQRRH